MTKAKLVALALAFHNEQSLTREIKNEFLNAYCAKIGVTLMVHPKYKMNEKFVLTFGNGKKKLIAKLDDK